MIEGFARCKRSMKAEDDESPGGAQQAPSLSASVWAPIGCPLGKDFAGKEVNRYNRKKKVRGSAPNALTRHE